MLMHLVLLEITINTHLKPHGRISSSEMVGIMVGQLSKYLVQRGPFTFYLCISSVQFSCSVMSNSLWPHEPQHTRPPCPSPTPRVHPNPCLLSQRCHPTISSSVVPFSCPQYFPASGSFPMSQLFTSGGQSTGVAASTSVLVGSPCSPRDPQESSPTPQFKSINSLVLTFLYCPTLTSTHDYWKNHSLD